MRFASDCREVVITAGRFLCFLPARPDMKRLWPHYVAFGLVASWLAGMGRYWDTPGAQWWQMSGLGSVAYTVCMATFLWLLIIPMRPQNWTYLNVLTFVGMTAPPAILYAIPVERFADPGVARQVNYGFLLVVATWRVALLWTFLRRSARLPAVPAFFALSFPLAAIMVVLGYFQLTMTIMEGMAGNRGGQESPNPAGEFVILLGVVSFFAFPGLFIGYGLTIRQLRKEGKAPDFDVGADAPGGPPADPSPGDSP